MFIINQPWQGQGEQFGHCIARLLQQISRPFNVFQACVAFAKASGVLRLAPSLDGFIRRGGRVELVVGIDEGITSRQALEVIMRYSTVAYVFNNPVTTFHPKVYLLEAKQSRAIAFVGSSNLTVGGLYTNYETNVGIEFDLTAEIDRNAYEQIKAVFTKASDLSSGNAKRLDADLLRILVRSGQLADETRPLGRPGILGQRSTKSPAVFPRTPIPPAPHIDPSLSGQVPRTRARNKKAPPATSAFQPWQVFVMLLGERDTRQMSGYSRDVYIPLAARDENPGFWGWPDKYKQESGGTKGNYPTRRISMLVRPATGGEQLVENVRLYYYDIKHEFRLNCGKLIKGAQPGDLLVIQRWPSGTLVSGKAFECEAAVVSSGGSEYGSFEKGCNKSVKGSSKKWGYL